MRRDNDEQFAEWRIGVDDLREVGNQVIAVATVNARRRASGVALHFPSATVFRFGSDHRITSARIYLDLNEALKAVGCRARRFTGKRRDHSGRRQRL